MSSCNTPQTFFLFKKTSFGNFKLSFSPLQNFFKTSEIITGFIIENSLKDGYFFSRGKNKEINKLHLFIYLVS